jgi:hypothetical protein
VAVFWVVAPFSLVEVCGRFRDACCLLKLTLERLELAKDVFYLMVSAVFNVWSTSEQQK